MKRKLNLALWIVAGILAVVFLVASSTKLFVPKEKLAGMGGAASRWVEDFSPGALKAIGALEFLAAVGLIVPAAVGIAPVLVPLAATGAVLLFAGLQSHPSRVPPLMNAMGPTAHTEQQISHALHS